jgi:dUTP pyrophosphatase
VRRPVYLGAVADPLEIQVVQLDPGLPLPGYARPGDAGLDLAARVDVTLAPSGGRGLVPTGVAIALPLGYAGFVQPRSGLALRHGVTLLNTPGLIDCGYRDELKVLMVNLDPEEPFEIHRGDRIAQLVVQAVAQVTWVPVEELPPSERGGGFGHTGR